MFTPTKRALALSLALASSVALAGCAGIGQLSPTAIADINQTLAVGCPIVTAVQGSTLKLNRYQTAALNTLASVCPPNPPPTSEAVAVADVLSAVATLQPLLAKK